MPSSLQLAPPDIRPPAILGHESVSFIAQAMRLKAFLFCFTHLSLSILTNHDEKISN